MTTHVTSPGVLATNKALFFAAIMKHPELQQIIIRKVGTWWKALCPCCSRIIISVPSSTTGLSIYGGPVGAWKHCLQITSKHIKREHSHVN